MAYKGSQLGRRQYARRRVGMDFPEWLGIRKEGDPSSIPPNQFRHAENVDLLGGEVVARGGQSKFNSDSALSGCPMGIFEPEYQFDPTGRVYIPGEVNNGTTSGGRIHIFKGYDTLVQNGGQTYNIAHNVSNVIYFGRRTGSNIVVERLTAPATTPASIFTAVSGLANGTPTHFLDISGTIYVGVLDNAAGSFSSSNGTVVSWNGSTVTVEDTHAAQSLVCLGKRGTEPHAFYGGGTALTTAWRYKTGGVWTDITLPAGVGSGKYYAFEMEEFGSKLYVGGYEVQGNGQPQIMSWDGVTAIEERDIAPTGVGTRNQVISLITFDSKLCYLWCDGNPTRNMKLGTYNGSSWDDAVFDFTTFRSAYTTKWRGMGHLFVYDSSLWAIIYVQDFGMRLFKSAGTNLSSNWSEIGNFDPEFGGDFLSYTRPAVATA